MIRIYHDIDGHIRTLEKRGPGRYVKWHKEHFSSSSTIWFDRESKRNYQIPDNAWEVMNIQYVDREVES